MESNGIPERITDYARHNIDKKKREKQDKAKDKTKIKTKATT